MSKVAIKTAAVMLLGTALLLAECPFASAGLTSHDVAVPAGCHHPAPLPAGTHSCCFATHHSGSILVKASLDVDPGTTIVLAKTTFANSAESGRVPLAHLLLAASPPGPSIALRI